MKNNKCDKIQNENSIGEGEGKREQGLGGAHVDRHSHTAIYFLTPVNSSHGVAQDGENSGAFVVQLPQDNTQTANAQDPETWDQDSINALFGRHAYVADAIETRGPGRGMYSSPWHWRDGAAPVLVLFTFITCHIKSPNLRRVTSLGKRKYTQCVGVQNLKICNLFTPVLIFTRHLSANKQYQE